MAVLAKVLINERHVYPFGAGLAVLFPDELVEGQMVTDILEPLPALLAVAVNAEVSGLALHVLRVLHATHGLVQFLLAKARPNLDGFVHSLAQRLQDKGSQINQVYHLLHRGLVVDTFGFGRLRGV